MKELLSELLQLGADGDDVIKQVMTKRRAARKKASAWNGHDAWGSMRSVWGSWGDHDDANVDVDGGSLGQAAISHSPFGTGGNDFASNMQQQETHEAELKILSRWRDLEVEKLTSADKLNPMMIPHIESQAVPNFYAAMYGAALDTVQQPVATDTACGSRELHEVASCPRFAFTSDETHRNDHCPITLATFEEGEEVRVLPSGHLMSAEGFDSLIASARADAKTPISPLTRK
eukprot:4496496-Prymnesium_polylepis.1